MAESRARSAGILAALTIVYFMAGRFGLSMAIVNESASAVWPPTGIAVAVLLLLGSRAWPVIFVGAFLVNVTTSGVIASSAAIAVGNTLEGLVAARLAARFARGRAAFEHPADIFRFTLVAAIAATAIAASIGTASLLAAGLAQPQDASSIWLTWWLGDAVGTMLVAPLVLLWANRPFGRWTVPHLLEAVGLLTCIVTVSFAVFEGPFGNYPLQFLTIPVLLWPAFRFGVRETATTAVVNSIFAIHGTLRGVDPFVRESANESLLLLQAFVGVTTTVLLVVAAEAARRRAAEAAMRTLNDALERRVAERTEELTKVHDRLSEAQQVAHIGSWEWDVAANALWWSDELYEIYGVDPGGAPTYEAFLQHVHPDDRELIDTTVRRAMSDGRPFAFDHRIVRPDGTVRVLHGEGRVVMSSDGRPVRMMGTGHDITERRRADEEREQLIREQVARREAEEASRAKDRFLATVSHELRTPLNAALGWARLALDLPAADERIPHAIEAIYRNLRVQSRLVSDIMDLSRAAAGSLALEQTPVDVSVVVRAAIETVRNAAAGRRVTFQTNGSDVPCIIIGDAQRLQQVVWNLLENAVKFSRSDSVVHVTVKLQPDAVEIAVADSGPGIDPAFLPHVFEEFRQGDESVSRTHGGLGLGLAIARHIVERHGGTIAASNRPEGGALFTVRLPAEAAMVG